MYYSQNTATTIASIRSNNRFIRIGCFSGFTAGRMWCRRNRPNVNEINIHTLWEIQLSASATHNHSNVEYTEERHKESERNQDGKSQEKIMYANREMNPNTKYKHVIHEHSKYTASHIDRHFILLYCTLFTLNIFLFLFFFATSFVVLVHTHLRKRSQQYCAPSQALDFPHFTLSLLPCHRIVNWKLNQTFWLDGIHRK